MITETMTDFEIYEEVRKEHGLIISYVDRIAPKYRRPILKSNKFPIYFNPIEYETKKGNKYLIFIEARCKKDCNSFLYTIICIYNKSGLNAVMLNSNNTIASNITIYSPHFFSRYRTRFLKDEKISTLDVIKRYFKINPTAYPSDVEDSNSLALTCNEGVLFGKISDRNVVVVKTYVSFDMLYSSQNDFKEACLEALIKYREEIQ